MIALRAASQWGVFGPGFADAAPAEIVLAGQLDGIWEHVQANGADELLLETVPPRLSHVRGHRDATGHTLTVSHFYETSRPPSQHRKHNTLAMSLLKKMKTESMSAGKISPYVQPLWPNLTRLPDRWRVLLIAAAWRQIPENWSAKASGEDDNTLVLSTHTAGADVSQITVNGAFLSSKSLTQLGLPSELVCL